MVATSSSSAVSSHGSFVSLADPVKDLKKLANDPDPFGSGDEDRSDIEQSLNGVSND